MALTIFDAIKLIERGEAEECVSRFIGSVQAAVFSKTPIAINLDDALVASLVLARLADSADGRKILKIAKRKNTQYKAACFGFQSPQRAIAREIIERKIFYKEGLNKLEATFDGGRIPDRERTLKRLLDDLIEQEEKFVQACKRALILAGADGTKESQDEAAKRIISAFTNDRTGIAK